MPPREPGHDARVWLATARDLLLAAGIEANPVRIRCFCGQRAVELAVKAVLLHRDVKFPYIHALQELIALVPDEVPDVVHESAGLTPYAVEEMYPGTFTDVDVDHAAEAVELARAVIDWAASVIESDTDA